MLDGRRRLINRLRFLFRARQFDRDLEEEMRFHLEMKARENRNAGMAPEEALYAARRRFGNATLLKEVCRDMWGQGTWERLGQDLRYALRMLRMNPGFTAAALLTLALGTGANTAIFSVLNAVLLRPLPYAEPDRVLAVWETFASPQGRGQAWLCAPRFTAWRERNTVFEGMAMYESRLVMLEESGTTERLMGMAATSDLFRVLGVEPLLGRTFAPGEDQPGKERVAVLSHGLWRRRFGADPNLVGKTIPLKGGSYSIIGVMPPTFQFPPFQATDIWIPMTYEQPKRTHGLHNWMTVARLKPGVTLAQARSQMEALTRNLEEGVEARSQYGVLLQTLLRDRVGWATPVIWLLAAAVGMVLLIGCANVASLLLARMASRRVEVAVRAAVGAGRWRLVRQFLTESLLLAALGSGLGLLLSRWLLKLLKLSPFFIPRLREAALDGTVLAFSAGVAVLAVVIFGLLPALEATRGDLQQSLKESGRAAAGTRASRVRGLLIVAEVTLTVVLLAGAGLLLRSLWLLQRTDPGFRPEHILTMRVPLPPAKYTDNRATTRFYEELLERVSALAPVRAAGMISRLPPNDWGSNGSFQIKGRPAAGDADLPFAELRFISPNYFPAMGIPLRRGRFFDARDRRGAPCVRIINETCARRYWPDDDALSADVQNGCTVVGIVADVRNAGLNRKTEPEMYIPHLQYSDDWRLDNQYLVVRSAVKPESAVAAIRSELARLDTTLRLTNVRTMEARIADSFVRPRFQALLVAALAGLALLLAVIGLYGVISYEVARRTHEIGIRVALGAEPRRVVGMALWHGLRLTLIGLACGLAGALALTRVLSSFLYGVGPRDPASFAAVSALVTAVALLATYIPARRASKVDPIVALRYE